jgi:hypothetical protein
VENRGSSSRPTAPHAKRAAPDSAASDTRSNVDRFLLRGCCMGFWRGSLPDGGHSTLSSRRIGCPRAETWRWAASSGCTAPVLCGGERSWSRRGTLDAGRATRRSHQERLRERPDEASATCVLRKVPIPAGRSSGWMLKRGSLGVSTTTARLEPDCVRVRGVETASSSLDESKELLAVIDSLLVRVLDRRVRTWIGATSPTGINPLIGGQRIAPSGTLAQVDAEEIKPGSSGNGARAASKSCDRRVARPTESATWS